METNPTQKKQKERNHRIINNYLSWEKTSLWIVTGRIPLLHFFCVATVLDRIPRINLDAFGHLVGCFKQQISTSKVSPIRWAVFRTPALLPAHKWSKNVIFIGSHEQSMEKL